MAYKLSEYDSQFKFTPTQARQASGLTMPQLRDLLRVQGRSKKVHFRPQWPAKGQGTTNLFSFSDCILLAVICNCRRSLLERPLIEDILETVKKNSRSKPTQNPLSILYFSDQQKSLIDKDSLQTIFKLNIYYNSYSKELHYSRLDEQVEASRNTLIMTMSINLNQIHHLVKVKLNMIGAMRTRSLKFIK